MSATTDQFKTAMLAAGLTPPTEIIDDGDQAGMCCTPTASRLAASGTGAKGLHRPGAARQTTI